MYRYIVDNAITYTPDDLVLFRESPFAAWMERLTLENPDHGIPPDLDSIGVNPPPPQQDDIIATLRSEGRNVALIDPQDDEPDRRVATLEAMRVGADFIVNGQLAAGALSGAVDLLMRTSGFSELGDFLYIPCETRVENSLQSPFRLCFAAELLANLQGQLPAQMLIIRDGAEVVPLQTEDHIYYYRAVEKRFLNAMNIFRKHRMPDPAESAHFGRWAECASEVLKQQALSASNSESNQEELQPEEAAEPVVEMPQLRVASGAGAAAQYDVDVAGRKEFAPTNYSGNYSTLEGAGCDSDTTLAEQARLLTPGRYGRGAPPGHTPSLARIGKPLSAHAAKGKLDELTADASSVATDSDEPVSEEPVAEKPVAKKIDAIKRVSDQAVSDQVASDEPTPGEPTPGESTPGESTPDEALDNLEFIGSGPNSVNGLKFPEMDLGEAARAAPAPNLRDTSTQDLEASFAEVRSAAVQELPEREPRPPVFLPPEQHEARADPRTEAKDERRVETRSDSFPGETLNTQQLDTAAFEPENADSVVDLDSSPLSTVAPVVQRAEEVFKRLIRDDPMYKKAEPANPASGGKANNAPDASTFSNSLQTSED